MRLEAAWAVRFICYLDKGGGGGRDFEGKAVNSQVDKKNVVNQFLLCHQKPRAPGVHPQFREAKAHALRFLSPPPPRPPLPPGKFFYGISLGRERTKGSLSLLFLKTNIHPGGTRGRGRISSPSSS